jgi:hypothetical protein
VVSYEVGANDPWPFHNNIARATSALAPNSSPQGCGDIVSASSTFPGATSVGEVPEGEGEPPFLSEEPSRPLKYAFRHYAPRKDVDDNAPARPPPCPRLSGQSGVERKAELNALLQLADFNGAKARQAGEGSMLTIGKTFECKICQKRDRHDRLLSHIVYIHLELKTWACPLWFVCFY